MIKKLKTVAKNRKTVPTKITFFKTEDLKPAKTATSRVAQKTKIDISLSYEPHE